MNKHWIRGWLAAAVLIILTRSTQVSGQADANAPVDKPVVHAYDVRDFLLVVKNYPLTGSPVPLTRLGEAAPAAAPAQQAAQQQQLFQGPPPPNPADADAGRQSKRMEELKKLITDHVDTKSWKENGGSIGSISSFSSELVITQTTDNQKAVADLLESMRASRGSTVRVRADWVLLSADQVEKLQKNSAEDKSALPEIRRDLLRALPDTTVHYSSSIACFSGQTVHIASGRTKSVVTSLTPVYGMESAAINSGVTYIQEGISLEVTPTVAGDTVTLDLASIVTEPGKSAPSTRPSIDRIDSPLQHLHTAVQAPLNKAVLIAGATSDPTPQDPSGKQMYLIIEADGGK